MKYEKREAAEAREEREAKATYCCCGCMTNLGLSNTY
jgi:hypothetical protein